MDSTHSAVDGASLKVADTIKVVRRPRGIVFNHRPVSDLRLRRRQEPQRRGRSGIPQGGRPPSLRPHPDLLALHPDGATLFVQREDNMVPVLDTRTKKVLARSRSARSRKAWASAPDGQFLVNTSETTSEAHFIDTKGYSIVANVLVDSRPTWWSSHPTASGSESRPGSVAPSACMMGIVSRLVAMKTDLAIPDVPEGAALERLLHGYNLASSA
jgi:hypothetical protein